ncbi:MAG: hypothetical protein K2W95_04510 [Candidatus Obscuribacterales bacterium]|nr:hypothetical protein [Candidatus Obscuribacterales bacterium]
MMFDQSARIQKLILTITLAVFTTVSAKGAAGQDMWKTFSPSSGDFTIDMPGQVEKASKSNVTFFYSVDLNGNKYVVMNQPDDLKLPDPSRFNDRSLDEIAIGMKRSLAKTYKFEGQWIPVKGNGWEGRQLNATHNGRPTTLIVAISASHDFMYTLIAGCSANDYNAQKFLHSFKVSRGTDSSSASAHLNRGPDYRAAGEIIGEKIGAPMILLLGVLWFISRKRKRS